MDPTTISAAEADSLNPSWQRCRERFRLGREQGGAAPVLTAAEQGLRDDAGRRLLVSCREELAQLATLVRPIGYAVLVADAGGMILQRLCDPAGADGFDAAGSRPGGLWSEDQQGTNGIGTCLVEARALTVHRHEHFHRQHAGLSCSGAPLFDPDGRLVAVLDLCSVVAEVSDHAHALALSLVVQFALAMEERLFRERHCRELVLALPSAASLLLLAVDADHRINGANRAARQVLGLDADPACELWSVFDRNPAALCRRGGEDFTVELTRGGGAQRWCGRATRATVLPGGGVATPWLTRPRAWLPPPQPKAGQRVRGGLPPAALQRVQRQVQSQLQERLDLPCLAAAAGLSVHHFCRAFKQSVGVSPHRYLMQQRVERAAALLAGTQQRLSDIAAEAGFADQSHLSRYFTRVMGQTPSAWRRRGA